MTRIARTAPALAALAALIVAGCGSEIDVPEDQPRNREAAQLFLERCSGCHTLAAANSYGSRPDETPLKYQERTNGPNFDTRKESKQDVLYAIRNGGFSGAIMPANIVVGEEADKVASFVAEYAGRREESSGRAGGAGTGQ